jgi:hypothetical protein
MHGVAGVTKIRGVVAALALLALGVITSQAVAGSSQSRWFQVGLATGETNGYGWSTGAKGPKHQPLSRICTEISMSEPARNGVSEGRDSTDCSELKVASDSVVSTESLGPKKSGATVVEAIYRPLVRKATIVFASGKRTVLSTQSPNRIGRGIPMFRYAVAAFSAGNCVYRIVAFDGKGKVVSSEVSPPC